VPAAFRRDSNRRCRQDHWRQNCGKRRYGQQQSRPSEARPRHGIGR
jgi:hypothetical protein